MPGPYKSVSSFWQKQKEEKLASLKLGKDRAEQCAEELNLMYQEARCSDYEGLAAAARKIKSLRDNRSSLSEVEEGLLAFVASRVSRSFSLM